MDAWLPPLRHLVDVAIAVALIEAVLVIVHHRRSGFGVAPRDFAVNMASGLSLMLALRCAVTPTGWFWIVLCVMLAGMFHAADMWLRWKRPEAPLTTTSETSKKP